MKPNSIFIFFVFLFFFCWGCASSPDIVTTDKKNATGYSNAQIREITIDQPKLLSGDFFRKRTQTNAITDVDSATASSGEKTISANQEALEKKVNVLQNEVALLKTSPPKTTPILVEKSLQDNEHPLEKNHMKLKIGLLIDRGRVLADTVKKISLAAEKFVGTGKIVLVGNDEIYETLAQNNALENKDLYRTSGILTVYPGIRMLVLVENFTLPEAFPGMGSAMVSMVDAGLLYRYKPVKFEMPIKTDQDASKFVTSIIYSTFTKAIESSQITPWFCRMFSSEENLMYINAGEKTGLEKGMLLKVSTPGKQIKSPAGTPAGWIPGKVKGVLKVERFFGKDFAACSVVEGEKPTVFDCLGISQK